MVDHNIFFHVAQLTGIIVSAANVIAVPALRHGITGDAPVGEQRGLIKYFKVLEFLCSCVYSHLGFLPFFFGNGKHTTHLPQSLLKHLLPLRLLRKGRVQSPQPAKLRLYHMVIFHTVSTILFKVHVAFQFADGLIVQPQRFL